MQVDSLLELLDSLEVETFKKLGFWPYLSHLWTSLQKGQVDKNLVRARLSVLCQAIREQKKALKLTLSQKEMNFGYDQSLLRQIPALVILKVNLYLYQGGEVERAKYIAGEWARRKKIQPRVSCGSVFQALTLEEQKRLELPVSSAGYVIDKLLGMRGKLYGPNGEIQIAPNHANFIQNNGQGTAEQVLQALREIKTQAQVRLDLKLRPEINFLGFEKEEIADLLE